MSFQYPGGLDSPATFGTPVGTSPRTNPDHAQSHTDLAGAVGTIEFVIGTTTGTNVFRNIHTGNYALPDNRGTAVQYLLQLPKIDTIIDTGGSAPILDFKPTANIGTQGNNFTMTDSGSGTAPTLSVEGNVDANIGISIAGKGSGTVTVTNLSAASPFLSSGTYNGGVLGTPTIGTITVPGTVNPLSPSASLAPANGTLTDSAGGTLTVNAQASNIYYCVMGTAAGNRTIGTPQNASPFQSLTYAIKASGSANGTLVWAGIFRFSQDVGTPVLGTGVTWNYYAWRYNSIDTKWDFQGNVKNII